MKQGILVVEDDYAWSTEKVPERLGRVMRLAERVSTTVSRVRAYIGNAVPLCERVPDWAGKSIGPVEWALYASRYVGLASVLWLLWTVDVRFAGGQHLRIFSGDPYADSRTALILLFGGSFVVPLLVLVVICCIKFVQNIVDDVVDKLLPAALHSIATSLIILAVVFSLVPTVDGMKAMGLGAYYQAKEVVAKAELYSPKVDVMVGRNRHGRRMPAHW
jgi:hypothetical protein